jgi:hypothetical protein
MGGFFIVLMIRVKAERIKAGYVQSLHKHQLATESTESTKNKSLTRNFSVFFRGFRGHNIGLYLSPFKQATDWRGHLDE